MSASPRALLETDPGEFAAVYAKADAKTVRSLLKDVAKSKTAFALMVRAWVEPANAERTWPRAMNAVTVFTTPYKLWYKKKWLVQLAADAELVDAVRAAAVGAHEVPDEMVAVLAIEGSDASVDALLPYFTAATTTQDRRLDVIRQLKRLPLTTAPVIALFESANRSRDARMATSPAVAFAASIGLPAKPGLHFSVRLGSVASAGSVPAVQVVMTVDSREINWFDVSVSRMTDLAHTSFDSVAVHADQLKLGSAPPDQWPSWLARAGKVLKVRWAPDVWVGSSFRGAKRDLISHWLTAKNA